MIAISFRMLRRDWRAGELRVLIMAVLIAVACVSSVTFFTDRIAQALQHQSSELLGADLRIVADHSLDPNIRLNAKTLGLEVAETRTFRSMVLSNEKTKLAEIKAVTQGYPLRGALKISQASPAQSMMTEKTPATGEAWVSPRFLQQFELSVGDEVQLGSVRLLISEELVFEPDRSGDMFSIAPRLLMSLDDLNATGLVQEGSRLHYTLLVAGEPGVIKQFRREVEKDLKYGERIEDVTDARREVRIALMKAQQFLGLAAVVAVILACVAIAMSARRFAQRHMDTCAMLRCFGARQNQINALYLYQLLLLGLIAGPLGVMIGYLAQEGLVVLLGQLLLSSLPSPSWTPAVVGILVAIGGLVGFALPPILQLRNVSTLRVLRREKITGWDALQPLSALSYIIGLIALAMLVLFQTGDTRLGLMLIVGIMGTVVVLWVVARIFVFAIKLINQQSHSAWRFGLSNISRHAGMSVVQIMAFGVGIMVLLLLTVVRGDLLNKWADSLPADASNRFIVGIQPDQLKDIQQYFDARDSADKQSRIELFPMVRGRLVAINDKAISANDFENPRAKNLIEREFNLSWASQLQADNTIVEGQWWDESAQGKNLFSIEAGIAKTLGLKMGDQLTYQIAGEKFTAKITNVRTVQWDSFRANFFLLTPPGALDGFPVSYMTSFYLPPEEVGLLDTLVRQHPNLTVIDIAAIMDHVRLIIERVSLAVEYVFLFTLAAGLAVMVAAIQSTLDVRLYENAILRALGARQKRLWRSLAIEFVTLGGLAGLLAALLASVLGYFIARYVLELDYVVNPMLWIVGLMVGGVGVGLAGIIGTRKVVKSSPLKVLREL